MWRDHTVVTRLGDSDSEEMDMQCGGAGPTSEAQGVSLGRGTPLLCCDFALVSLSEHLHTAPQLHAAGPLVPGHPTLLPLPVLASHHTCSVSHSLQTLLPVQETACLIFLIRHSPIPPSKHCDALTRLKEYLKIKKACKNLGWFRTEFSHSDHQQGPTFGPKASDPGFSAFRS